MPIIPAVALPSQWIVTDIAPKYEGKDATRRVVGTQIKALLTMDHCAQVPITILDLDASTLPSQELINERNLNMDFLVAEFQNLSVSFSGGDFGSIRYKGTASGVKFLNSATPTSNVPSK